MFSTGFSSGERDGSRMMVRFFGTLSLPVLCHPARSGTIHQDDGVGFGGDVAADLVKMYPHGRCVGEGQHEGGPLAPPGADGAEVVGVGVSLIGGQAWACSGLGPNSRAAVLLPQPGFVLKPDLDPRGWSGRLVPPH